MDQQNSQIDHDEAVWKKRKAINISMIMKK